MVNVTSSTVFNKTSIVSNPYAFAGIENTTDKKNYIHGAVWIRGRSKITISNVEKVFSNNYMVLGALSSIDENEYGDLIVGVWRMAMDIIQAFNIYPEDSKDDTTTITNEFGYSIPYLFIKQVKDVVGNYGAWAMKNSSGGVTIAGNSAFGGYDSSTGLFSYYTTSDYSTQLEQEQVVIQTSDIKDIYATYSAFSCLSRYRQSVISWGGFNR